MTDKRVVPVKCRPRVMELRFHAHCSHCGGEMQIDMDKTIDIDDNDHHWLITPCECLAAAPAPSPVEPEALAPLSPTRPCPCGEVPTTLICVTTDFNTFISGDCCGNWRVETDIACPDEIEATTTWNAARRTPKTNEDELARLVGSIQARADNAYITYITLCRRDECLGWEAKTEKGIFGGPELEAHKSAAEQLGRHRALQLIANELRGLLEHHPTDKNLVRVKPTGEKPA